jgi:glycerol uptake facilitator-like aquaporin
MFGLPIIQVSAHIRPTLGEGLAEAVATFGLVLIVFLALKYHAESIPVAVGAYIASAYWFTSSTSFANPAVTFARALSDTFAGISPNDVPAFIAAQVLGAVLAHVVAQALWMSPAE